MTGSPHPAPPPRAWLPAVAVLAGCLAAYAVAAPLLYRSGGADAGSEAASGAAAVAGIAVLVLLWLAWRGVTAVRGELAEASRVAARQADQLREQAAQLAAQAGQLAEQERWIEQALTREQRLTDEQGALRGRLGQSLADQQALGARAQSLRQALKYTVTVRLPAAREGGNAAPAEQPGDLDAELAKLLDQLVAESVRAGDREESMRSAVVTLSRRVQAAAHRIQEEATLMAERHSGDPGVLDVSMRVDHAAAQQARHAQSMAVLCGEWPGQQWPEPLPLVDVVRAAAGRIIAYRRIEVAGDPNIAAAASVVEPLIHLLAELLANATQSSPPATAVPVTVRAVQRGAVIEVNDCGVGLDDHRLTQAREVASGARLVGLDDLGEVPQTGLAVIGQYVRRHGFRVDVAESVYGGVRAVVGIPNELVETVAPAEASAVPQASAVAPASAVAAPSAVAAATAVPPATAVAAAREELPAATAGPGQALPRRRSPRHASAAAAAAGQPAGDGAEETGPEGAPVTPEQAGAWMGAYLSGGPGTDDGTGRVAGERDNSAQELR